MIDFILKLCCIYRGLINMKKKAWLIILGLILTINNKIIFSGNEIEIKTFLAGCLSNLTTTNK